MERHFVVCIGGVGDVIVWGGRQIIPLPSNKELKVLALSDVKSAPSLVNNVYIPEYNLDLIIGFMDAFGIEYLNDVKIPVIGYIPIDGPFTETWKHFLRNFHRIIAYSRFGYNELLKFFPPSKVHYIPHGISVDIFRPLKNREEIREDFEREYGIPKDAFLVLNIGANSGVRKELPLLMRTFKSFVEKHDDAYLFMQTNAYAVFPKGYDLIVWRRILKMEKHIHFPKYNPIISPTTNEQLAEVYNAADVYVQNCYSEDTRILTETGIKTYKELRGGDRVFTLNSEGEIELNPIEHIYVYRHSGTAIKIENKQVSLLVTPNHRVYYYTPKKRDTPQVRLAGELLRGTKTRYYIPTRGVWKGKNDNYMELDEWQKQVTSESDYNLYQEALKLRGGQGWGSRRISQALNIPETRVAAWLYHGAKPWGRCKLLPRKVLTSELLELIGWYIAEGSIRRGGKNNKKENNVVFSVGDGRKREYVRSLLMKLGFNPIESRGDLIVSCIPLVEIVGQCERGVKKTIPDWVLQFSPDLLICLYRGLMGGDGSRSDHHVLYYTSSTKLRDKFIELCLKLGYSVRFWRRITKEREIEGHKARESEGWVISIREKYNKGSFNAERDVREVDYDGVVWCVSVKNSNVFVERGGVIQMCGNSVAEGFGLPIVEAMSCGVPAIVPRNSAQIELVERGCGWIVENVPAEMYVQIPIYVPLNTTYPVPNQLSLLEKLEEAYSSPAQRKRYGEAARKYVVGHHNWETVMEKWFKLLDEVEAELLIFREMAT